jgi:hypothetical protein
MRLAQTNNQAKVISQRPVTAWPVIWVRWRTDARLRRAHCWAAHSAIRPPSELRNQALAPSLWEGFDAF